MKNKILFLTLTAALAFGLAGCSKNDTSMTAADEANKAADSAAAAAAKTAEAAKVEAAKVAAATKAEAEKAAEAAKVEKAAEAAKVEAAKAAEAAKVEAAKADQAAKVEAAKVADNAKAQGLIDQAKTLIAEGKFSDASSMLQQLTGLSLTDAQTKLVASLKDQIQKAMAAKAAADATSAAGNLLKP
jgi:colicin import membrane protein